MQHVLIFTGGEHPTKRNFDAYLHTVAVPTYIIAADSGLLCARAFGYVPNLIVGDMDSLYPDTILDDYPKKCIHLLPQDKDDTDTVVALKVAIAHGADFITLCGGDGGRIDHLIGIVKQFEQHVFPHVWLCSTQIIFALQPADTGKAVVLYLSPQQCASHVSFFAVPTVCPRYCIQSEGLIWPLAYVHWEQGEFSLSNRITEEYRCANRDVVITVEAGRFIAIVPY
ncbi:MAG: thiamine diphosphokinase [Treponema sp.]